MMKRVIIESPLRGDYEANREYARRCMRDSLKRGEAPYASHLLFDQPGILDDRYQHERDRGMRAGFAWGEVAELCAVYVDLGISDGMLEGIRRAATNNIPIEYRRLSDSSSGVLVVDHIDGDPQNNEPLNLRTRRAL